MKTSKIQIDKIKTGKGTQAREGLNYQTVIEYAEAMAGGTIFPPVTVYHDGAAYWLADGFHRIEAARQAGLNKIDADVKSGTQRDAILFASGANAAHGLRRTNADKRRAVLILLEDAEWSQWSDRKIARHCGVTHPFVAKLRAWPSGNDYHSEAFFTFLEWAEEQFETASTGLDDIGSRCSADAPPPTQKELNKMAKEAVTIANRVDEIGHALFIQADTVAWAQNTIAKYKLRGMRLSPVGVVKFPEPFAFADWLEMMKALKILSPFLEVCLQA